MSELLPCPFCGEAAKLGYFNNEMTWYAQCSNWKCGSKTHSTLQDAVIAAWNRRQATPSSPPPQAHKHESVAVSERQVEAAADVLAQACIQRLIESPLLPAECWHGLARSILTAVASGQASEKTSEPDQQDAVSVATPIADEAREAVRWAWKNGGYQAFSEEQWVALVETLERESAVSVAEALERAAGVCDEQATQWRARPREDVDAFTNAQFANVAESCAAAIRKLLPSVDHTRSGSGK